MATQTETTTREREEFVRDYQSRLNHMRDGLNRLESELDDAQTDAQRELHESIRELKKDWRQLQVKLDDLKTGPYDDWVASTRRAEEDFHNFQTSFTNMSQRAERAYDADLGWVQGFTNSRPHDSAGWAEGMGHRPEGSAGWAEGMGHRPEGSKGWAEGYDKTQK